MTLAGARNKVYFFNGKEIVALDKESGDMGWVSAEMPVFEKMATYFAPKLVVQGGTVIGPVTSSTSSNTSRSRHSRMTTSPTSTRP